MGQSNLAHHSGAIFSCVVQIPKGAGVIQGDGINLTSLSKILSAVLKHGYSAEVQITHPFCREQSALQQPCVQVKAPVSMMLPYQHRKCMHPSMCAPHPIQ